MKNFIVFLFLIFVVFAEAQEPANSEPIRSKRQEQLGVTIFGFRGYDFSKEIYRVRDKYQYSIAPGLFYMRGNNKRMLRISLQYSHVAIDGPLHYRAFSSWLMSSYVPTAQFQRECLEARLGYVFIFNAQDRDPVHVYYATDLVYGYGRQKFAIVYNEQGGNATIIGYQFNTIANLHTLGFKIDLKSNFCLYAETGFAIDSQFGLRNYNYANLKYFNPHNSFSANFRVLQVGITKGLSREK